MIKKTFAVTAIVAGAALGFASPASAQLDAGDYSYTVTNDSDGDSGYSGTLHTDSCGQNCLHVTEDDGADYQMSLNGNTWSGSHDGGECTWTVSVDNTTLAGKDTCDEMWIEYQLENIG